MPLLHSKVSKSTYQNIDKVEQCLSRWIATHLSLAGRVTLVQSVLHTIPIYVMQTTNMSASVKRKIDQACRKFI